MARRTNIVDYEKNPRGGIPWDLIIFVAAVGYAWDQNWLKLQETLGLPFWKKRKDGGTPPPGGDYLSREDAIRIARDALLTYNPIAAAGSDEQIAWTVCQSNPALYISDKALAARVYQALCLGLTASNPPVLKF